MEGSESARRRKRRSRWDDSAEEGGPKEGDSTKKQKQDNEGKFEWGKLGEESAGKQQEKEKANFGLSGALNKDAKTGKLYKGFVMKWSEPVDAVTPMGPGWRLYIFEGDDLKETLHIHRQSAFLIGNEPKIADILIEGDESVDQQHAVIQFRIKTKQPPPGSLDAPKRYIRPYIMDLESKHGTTLNKKQIEPARYYELLKKDVLRFGENKRDYVVMYSKD